MRRIGIWLMLLSVLAGADLFEEGQKVFADKCSLCHVGHIDAEKIKENFFEKKNTIYMLGSPTVNMLAYAIMRGPKRIGDPSDPEMRQAEIEEYLKTTLYHPKRENSICDPEIMKYYDDKPPLKATLTEREISALARYFMEYKKRRRKTVPLRPEMLNEKYNAAGILSEAKAHQKRIIIEASSSHCPWCKKMHDEVLTDGEVQKMLQQGFVMVDVNIDKHALPFGLMEKFKQITPTFFILESDGSLVARYPGSWTKEDFMKILQEYMPRK